MAWQRDSKEQIFERALSNVETRIPGADARLPHSNLNVLAYLHAEGLHGLYGYAAHIARQIDPRTADDDTIRRMATLWLEVPQKVAEAATGPVQFTGVNGAVVPAGRVITRSDGAEFITLAEGVIAASVAVVNVDAVVPGQSGNTAVGSVMSLAETLAGVNNQVTVHTGGLVGGADDEDIESIRARVIDRWREPPHGGAALDYKRWTLEVPGVTRAWVNPQQFGEGTVGIYFVRDGDANIIPDAGEVAAVQDYIDARRPVTAKGVTVMAPVGVPFDYTVQLLVATTQAVKDAIVAEVNDLLRQDATPAGTIFISRVRGAISNAPGEYNHVLTLPAADVVYTAGQLAVPGAPTWV